MITRPKGRTLLVMLPVAAILAGAPLAAQRVDSTRRWSLFGGMTPAEGLTGTQRIPANFEFGGSGDFHLGAFPLPLRATIAFGHADQPYEGIDLKFGTLTLDAVGRPVPKLLGTQLYFLGGLGLATRAGYFSVPGNTAIPFDQWLLLRDSFNHPRQNWAFVEGGAGLDVGPVFLQLKIQAPVASDGPWRAPMSVGFRF